MRECLSRRDVLRVAGLAMAVPQAGSAAAPACLESLLSRRRMVRRFKTDRVPSGAIRRLLAAAVRAPSAGHTQPWEFVIVRNARRRTELAEAASGQMFVAAAPVVIVACFDTSRASSKYQEFAELYGIIDTAFASLCMLFAVAETGLGACFVGAVDRPRVARILALPPQVRVLAVIPIGYPAESPRRMRVRRPREVVHLERWRGGRSPDQRSRTTARSTGE